MVDVDATGPEEHGELPQSPENDTAAELEEDGRIGISSSGRALDEASLAAAKAKVDEGELPSVGSFFHADGNCKPCAWFWKEASCSKASECTFCHLCDTGEIQQKKKRRKLEKAERRKEKNNQTSEPPSGGRQDSSHGGKQSGDVGDFPRDCHRCGSTVARKLGIDTCVLCHMPSSAPHGHSAAYDEWYYHAMHSRH